jgi:hypothetical protein
LAAAISVALVLAGCGQSRPSSARRQVTVAPPEIGGLAPETRLRGRYVFDGRRRYVDAAMAPTFVTDPWELPTAVLPARRRLVAVTMTWIDRGPDAFPHEWASFHARDNHGRALPGTYRGQLHERYPARPRRGQPVAQRVGFEVPEGSRLVRLEMSSIVKLWRFRAVWRLPRG